MGSSGRPGKRVAEVSILRGANPKALIGDSRFARTLTLVKYFSFGRKNRELPTRRVGGNHSNQRTVEALRRQSTAMKQILLLAGIATFALANPVFAKPGHGNPHGDSHGSPHGDGDGNSHHDGAGDEGPVGYGVGGCPPGLAKKNNGCMPPGQAKKLYNVGQRFPQSYGTPWTFNQIPENLRSQHRLPRSGNYYYGDGYLYRVDPRTMLIQQAVSALLYR